MSAQETVLNGLDVPVDQNAQAADDAKKLLAELQDEAVTTNSESNGVGNHANGNAKIESPEMLDRQQDGSDKHEKVETSERYDKRDNKRDNVRGGRGGHRGGRGGSLNYRNNIKSDLTTQEISRDPVAIRKQVEFYFSDSNLPMDKFLLGKVGGSKNHPVELSVIHSFKRMRHFQPFEAIVEALKESKILDLTNDDTCVRRKEPLPESLNDGPDPNSVKVFEDKAMPRSVYVKGFGEEVPSTQFDIEAFFAPYGPTNAIRLRRSDTKLFKGSVFAEFESEELAKKFLKLDPQPKYQGKDLQIMSKKEYCEKKVDDIKSGKIKPNSRDSGRKYEHKGSRGHDHKRKRDDEDSRDWRERREEDRKSGFRDDKRRGGRDSRDKRTRDVQGSQVERDDRGIPMVKSSEPKKDTGKAEALAQAKAAVEAEKLKEGQAHADNVESTQQDGTSSGKEEAANVISNRVQTDTEATGKKRGREDDDNAETARETKKIDVKV